MLMMMMMMMLLLMRMMLMDERCEMRDARCEMRGKTVKTDSDEDEDEDGEGRVGCKHENHHGHRRPYLTELKIKTSHSGVHMYGRPYR